MLVKIKLQYKIAAQESFVVIESYVTDLFIMFIKTSIALLIVTFSGICDLITSTWASLSPLVVSGTSTRSGSSSPAASSQSMP